MKKSIKRIISMISTGILILCTVLCLVSVVKATTGADPSILGFRCFYIVTGSMEPTIPVESAIIVHKQSSYEVDDIVTFLSDNADIKGSPNTHRIIDKYIEGGTVYYRTKGDANTLPDAEAITAAQICGKMIFKTGRAEWIGTFLSYMVTPAGFLTIVGFPIILITIISMKDYLKTLRRAIKQPEAATDQASTNGETSPDTPGDEPEKKISDEKEEQS